MEKTKFLSLQELIEHQPEEVKTSPAILALDREEKLEYSFSFYCYFYDRHNSSNSCKCRVNFCLKVQEVRFDENGTITNLKYKRTSYNNHHSHPLLKSEFLPRFDLLQFIENDLENFGSNTKPADAISFAKKKQVWIGTQVQAGAS